MDAEASDYGLRAAVLRHNPGIKTEDDFPSECQPGQFGNDVGRGQAERLSFKMEDEIQEAVAVHWRARRDRWARIAAIEG